MSMRGCLGATRMRKWRLCSHNGQRDGFEKEGLEPCVELLEPENQGFNYIVLRHRILTPCDARAGRNAAG